MTPHDHYVVEMASCTKDKENVQQRAEANNVLMYQLKRSTIRLVIIFLNLDTKPQPQWIPQVEIHK